MTKSVILTGIFSETNGLPKLFTDELDKHFEVIPEDKYFKKPEEYNQHIVAILPWFAKPTISEEMVKAMPKLVIVASISAGYNHLGRRFKSYKRFNIGLRCSNATFE